MANPNIFAQFAAPRSIADYQGDAQRREANALTLEGVKRKNAMEDMALQQGQAKQNALMQIMQGWTPKTTAQERAASLRTSPLTYGDADAIEKADLEAQKTRAGISAQDAESLTKNLGVLKRLTGAVMSDPTPENARAAIQMWEQLTGKQLPQERERVAFLQTPEQVRSWAAGYAMEADKLLPQLSTQNLGGNMASVARDPLSGAVTTNALTPITETANNIADNQRQVEEGRLNRGVQIRQQNLVDARQRETLGLQRERLAIDSGAAVADAGGPSQAAFTKRFGKAPAGYRWKADGSMESIPGGPTDRKSNEQLAGKETVDNVVAGLRSAYDALNTNDGITSTGKGPLTNIGAAVSRSGIGQVVGGALGSKNQKERDSIAQARPLLLQAIMKATGMSAKQMDSNAELKLYLATATDPTLTLEANREALDRIEQLYGSGALTAKPITGGATGSWGDKPAGNVVDFGSLK